MENILKSTPEYVQVPLMVFSVPELHCSILLLAARVGYEGALQRVPDLL